MTQYQQVLAAVKKLGVNGGKLDEIFNAIDGIKDWKAGNKRASVASYLSRSEEIVKEGDNWVYRAATDNTTNSSDGKSKQSTNQVERGLYFITLNPSVKPSVPGLLFKIGHSGTADDRLKAYGRSLPYNPIQELAFYRIPDDIDLLEAERQVRGELLGNDTRGFRVERFFGNHQNEWLQTLDLKLTEEHINNLAVVVNKIVKDTIDNLRKQSAEEENND